MCQQEVRSVERKGSAFSTEPSSPTSVTKSSKERIISWGELSLHNTVEDSWIAIKGRVYDVTNFSKFHPGGDILFTASGLDATDVFAGFHNLTDAWKLLPPLLVGTLEDAKNPPLPNVDQQYVQDIVEMRKQISALKLYDSSKLYYAYKIASNVALCSLSVAIVMYSGSWPAIAVAAFIMALFWQQCGWLAHDFLHHQVFNRRYINNLFGLLIGNIFQGFSVNWWKTKHNHHHAVPNVTDAPSGGDPDIATTPILFWSEKLIEGELEDLPLWMLRNQAVLYVPILCFARISWLVQSIQHNIPKPNPNVTGKVMYYSEIATLFLHHSLFLALVVKVGMMYSVPKALSYMMMSHAWGGILLGLVFAVGHNAMDVLTLEEMREVDFIRLQVRTTRNVNPNWFTDWLCGGLNYQVEHHIFPSVPRHHLWKLARILRAFCDKHKIPYTSKTLVDGNKDVCQLLQDVGKAA